MLMRRLLIGGLVAASLGSVALPAGYYRGGWRHDADRDGIPDRSDRAPLNPYVR